MEKKSQLLTKPLLEGTMTPTAISQGTKGRTLEAPINHPASQVEKHIPEIKRSPLFSFSAHLKDELEKVKSLTNSFVAEQEQAVVQTCLAHNDNHLLCILESGEV